MIRILLADDQALVRSGLRLILQSEPDFEVVGGEAKNGSGGNLAKIGDVGGVAI